MNPIEGRSTLGEYIIAMDHPSGDLRNHELMRILTAIRLASKLVTREIARIGIDSNIGSVTTGKNPHGEPQLLVDTLANDLFVKCLRNRNIMCGMVSEEVDDVILASGSQKSENKYIVMMDPLDGSSNISVNIPTGTIFSVIKRISPSGTKPISEDFLQSGRSILAAGYILYGPSTMLIFSAGNGVDGFTMDPSIGSFYHTHPNIRYPDGEFSIYSMNEGTSHSCQPGLRSYVDDLKRREKSARYVGSLVADFHRNLLKGGLFIYPATKKYPHGKLRLLYECAPMAFISEQAGGSAHNGECHILDVKPKDIHETTPLIIGPSDGVNEALLWISTDKIIAA